MVRSGRLPGVDNDNDGAIDLADFSCYNLFVLGNGLLHAIALEGALKIKEVSYVHAEGFPAGDMKHGVIALIEEGTPVVALVSDGEQGDRMITALEEVRTRGAHVIGISRREPMLGVRASKGRADYTERNAQERFGTRNLERTI